MKGQHPCNICTNKICSDVNAENACKWHVIYCKKIACGTYDCVMNYEGNCLADFCDECGACQ